MTLNTINVVVVDKGVSFAANHEDLGPLHTRAKSRDHEIVRAQQSVQRPFQDTSKIM